MGRPRHTSSCLKVGLRVSLTVTSYRQQTDLKAVLAVRQVNTAIQIKDHKNYGYKLRRLDIPWANQVWSIGITYIKTKGGTVYLAAIIDWHTKAVLSHGISNTLDSTLVMDVLDEALALNSTPELFNTDQSCQYTSETQTQRLKHKGSLSL